MANVAIVIPTLSYEVGKHTADLAILHAGMDTRAIVSVDKQRAGFSKTVNAGLAQLEPHEHVCIMNDDITWFQYGWLRILHDALLRNKHVAAAAPSGKSSTAPMCNGMLGDMGAELTNVASFWCVLIQRKALDSIGFLDERLVHYASDTLWCYRAVRKGWKMLWVRAVWLQHTHHGSGLWTKQREKDQKLYAKLRHGK